MLKSYKDIPWRPATDRVNGNYTPYFTILYPHFSGNDRLYATYCHEVYAGNHRKIGPDEKHIMILRGNHTKSIHYKINNILGFFEMVKDYYNLNDEDCLTIEPFKGGLLYVEAGGFWKQSRPHTLLLLKLLRIAWNWEGETLSQAVERYANEKMFHNLSSMLKSDYKRTDNINVFKVHSGDQYNMIFIPGMYVYLLVNGKVQTDNTMLFSHSGLSNHYRALIQWKKGRLPLMVH